MEMEGESGILLCTEADECGCCIPKDGENEMGRKLIQRRWHMGGGIDFRDLIESFWRGSDCLGPAVLIGNKTIMCLRVGCLILSRSRYYD